VSAHDYNAKQLASGALSPAHLAKLVAFWQRHHDLAVDGYAGPNTIDTLNDGLQIAKVWPLLKLDDGRPPHITSGFKTENGSRPTHDGVDMFYPWEDSDPAVKVGDGGAVKRNGKRRWWYPDGAVAVAAADGEVMIAGDTRTGWRCWIDHWNGERTGYFHGAKLLVQKNQVVKAGQPVIVVGHNPNGHDAKHLHFEVSPVDKYAPMNPRNWLADAVQL